MKFFNKILIVGLVFMISSCDMTELDLQQDPNQVAPEDANIDDLYNNIQFTVENQQATLWYWTASVSRMVSQTTGYDYLNALNPSNFNFMWNNLYAGFLPDVDALENIASERGLNFYLGASKILEAHMITQAVDVFGDIIYTEAVQGVEGNRSPQKTPGADVYAAADALLDEAIALLSDGNLTAPRSELLYGGDAAKWITLAKTLKIRNAVTTRLVNGGAAATINAMIADGDIIDEAGEDFQIQYGSTRQNPNSRHPLYNNSYEAADGDYMSNYYMWLLAGEKLDADGNEVRDPRLRYYFYRQVSASAGLDPNVYSCHLTVEPDQSQKPSYYIAVDPRLPYCYGAEDGYIGRDHLNNEGIPPDGFIRTNYGIYPAGGRFDDNSYERTQELGTLGALGQGIQPVWLSSFTHFMLAEAALTLGTNGDPRALLEEGVRQSIAKVMNFSGQFINENEVIGTDVNGNDVFLSAFIPTEEDIEKYVAVVLANYDAAANDDERLDVVMKEYFIALWGNGLEAYNMYRRTGKPDNMAPAVAGNPGAFPRSWFLPADHVNRNLNATQKTITEPVFWDTNPDGFVY